MPKNILVTGANGQLGSEIREIASGYAGFRFFFTDIRELDLSDKSKITDFIDKNKVEYVVNCAAYTAVDKAEDDVEICYLVNRDCVKNLAEATLNKAKIIHISTDYVFDGKGHRPYTEADGTNPQSIYGKSKLEGEQVLMNIHPESIIIRTAWLYSAFGNNFVKTMIKLGRERNSLNVVSDQKGTPTYAADLAKAILSIILFTEMHQSFPAGIYHYSNEGECSWYDFCLEIHKLAGINTCRISPVDTSDYPTKASRPMYSVLDKTKIKSVFQLEIPGWKISLEKFMAIINY
ncbi:MAG: dTDP-4-dehydrorhamnose reductase [Dysgonamonadaceae bacterium]|jgi:dTDP-4-dehydrorhamnose reductase|nr:dTDP-4-dehydrorhamnose reductase [Dysgonamonadaceae bacterium]